MTAITWRDRIGRRPSSGRSRQPGSSLGLYWRVFAANAAILALVVVLLALTPVTVDRRATQGQVVVLLIGLVVMLLANAWLLRFSLAPLRRLAELMTVVDVLEPGRRLDAAAPAEVAAVIATFNSTLDRLESERRTSMHRVLSGQELERRRIAQELHDQIGQNLTAVVLELKRVGELVDPSEAEALADAQELARESLDDLRRISYELRPVALDDLGLAPALAALCTGIAKRTGIRVVYEPPGNPLALDHQTDLAVYRIAQEALTNAARHADCSTVRVELRVVEDALVLRVADDGVGTAGRSPGGGIRGMRERALVVGGSFEIRSPPTGGTEVRLRVPSSGTDP